MSGETLVRSGVLTERRSATLIRVTGLVIMPILQVTCLIAAMVRWQSGASLDGRRPHYNPMVSSWFPKVGPGLPLVLGLLGVLVLGYAIWQATVARTQDEPQPASEAPAESAAAQEVPVEAGVAPA